jgi:hypothetical protein
MKRDMHKEKQTEDREKGERMEERANCREQGAGLANGVFACVTKEIIRNRKKFREYVTWEYLSKSVVRDGTPCATFFLCEEKVVWKRKNF